MYGSATVALVVCIGILIPALLATRAAPTKGVPAAIAAVERHTHRWQLIGLLVGIPTAIVVAGGALGRGLLLAAPAFGLCVLSGVLIGEATAPRLDVGNTRTAILEVRRRRDYLPVALAAAVIALAGGLATFLTIATLSASTDDLGHAGRALNLTCSSGFSKGGSPWPGSYYSIPLALFVLAGFGMATIAFQAVGRRPRPSAHGGLRAIDDRMRLRAGKRIVAACGVLVSIPAAGVALVSSRTLSSVHCGSAWMTESGWGLIGLALVSLGLLCWFAFTLVEATRSGYTGTQAA